MTKSAALKDLVFRWWRAHRRRMNGSASSYDVDEATRRIKAREAAGGKA